MITVLRMDGARVGHDTATGAAVSNDGHLELWVSASDQWALAVYAAGTWASFTRS